MFVSWSNMLLRHLWNIVKFTTYSLFLALVSKELGVSILAQQSGRPPSFLNTSQEMRNELYLYMLQLHVYSGLVESMSV
jgi:hypothetical protein